MPSPPTPLNLEIHPLSPDRWADLETLFGEHGATGGCWCMYWRLKRADFETQKGEGNRQAFKTIVQAGEPPGLLAYAEGQPVGWCALGPRADYGTLARSRVLKPVDEQPVWSIVCFFIAKPFRRRGVSEALLKAAVAYARERGAQIVEGYPYKPKKDRLPDVFAYTGLASSFRRVGFVEVLRRSETRPIMRYIVN